MRTSNLTPVADSSVPDLALKPLSPARHYRKVALVLTALLAGAILITMAQPRRLFRNLFWRATTEDDIYTVVPVTLNVTLREEGELKPVNSVELKNEVEGQRVTIEWIVPESTAVKKGDLLARLSSEDLRDRVETEEIGLRAAAGAVADAEQQLELTISENASRIRKAEIDLEIAKIEFERYSKGEFKKAETAIQIEIQKTEIERKSKEDELAKSIDLEKRQFISRLQVEQLDDEVKRIHMTLERLKLELEILRQYERVKNELQRKAAVEQAAEELEREKQRAASRRNQAEIKLNEQRESYALRQKRFERLKEQLAKCELYAPCDGVVQYGRAGESRYWSSNRIAAGEQVYPGQTLITLPDTSQMKVTTRIHEADRHKISEGLRCLIKVPAVPGRTFTGKLTKIAQFADSERSWLNPNLKEHAAEIMLDESDLALSPGDTAHIEILIEEVPDVLGVPVQCVFTRGSQHFVFVKEGLSAAAREVKLGRLTTTMVEITDGLKPEERVLMAPDDRLLATLPSPGVTRTAATSSTPPAPGPS